jgi:hypothetical protein
MDNDTKKGCQISIWPLACNINRFHIYKFSDRPSKRYDLCKIHIHYVNRNFILRHQMFFLKICTLYSIGADLRPQHKSGVCVFTCLACEGSDQGNLLFVTGQGWDEKLAGLQSQWQTLFKFFIQRADRTELKSGVGIPDINIKKIKPRTGYQILSAVRGHR